jgi:hypothetical protein
MRYAVLTVLLVSVLSPRGINAQAAPDADVLTTVRITQAVMAEAKPLTPGTYDVRLTGQYPIPLAGQSREAQRWVEFVADGKVVAREVAEVLYDQDLTPVGTSSAPVRSGARVEMLKGGEFLRISVKREGERYLIHLPVMP